MSQIPRPALILGLAGLLPFIGGTLILLKLMPFYSGPPFVGIFILNAYGAAILAFMGGCLWGFAAQADRAEWKLMAISVTPALWAFAVPYSPNGLISLFIGFIYLFILDLMFRGWGLGPRWWLALRAPLTLVVLICLGAGAFLA